MHPTADTLAFKFPQSCGAAGDARVRLLRDTRKEAIMRSKIIFVLISVAMVNLMLTGVPKAAQNDSPSLDETVQFLKDKAGLIYDIGGGRKYDGRVWTLASPSKCTIVWKTEQSNKGIPRKDVMRGKVRQAEILPTSVTLSLSDINPQKIGYDRASISEPNGNEIRTLLEFYGVSLPVTDNRNLIKWRGGDGNLDSNLLLIKFKDRQMASRYGKALNHAVNLCGGRADKKEPF